MDHQGQMKGSMRQFQGNAFLQGTKALCPPQRTHFLSGFTFWMWMLQLLHICRMWRRELKCFSSFRFLLPSMPPWGLGSESRLCAGILLCCLPCVLWMGEHCSLHWVLWHWQPSLQIRTVQSQIGVSKHRGLQRWHREMGGNSDLSSNLQLLNMGQVVARDPFLIKSLSS